MNSEQTSLGQTHSMFQKSGSDEITEEGVRKKAAEMSTKPVIMIDVDKKTTEVFHPVRQMAPAPDNGNGKPKRRRKQAALIPLPQLPPPQPEQTLVADAPETSSSGAPAVQWQPAPEPANPVVLSRVGMEIDPKKFFSGEFELIPVTFILQSGIEVTTDVYDIKFHGPSVLMISPISPRISIRPPMGTKIQFRHEGKTYNGESFDLYYDFPDLDIAILVFMIEQ